MTVKKKAKKSAPKVAKVEPSSLPRSIPVKLTGARILTQDASVGGSGYYEVDDKGKHVTDSKGNLVPRARMCKPAQRPVLDSKGKLQSAGRAVRREVMLSLKAALLLLCLAKKPEHFFTKIELHDPTPIAQGGKRNGLLQRIAHPQARGQFEVDASLSELMKEGLVFKGTVSEASKVFPDDAQAGRIPQVKGHVRRILPAGLRAVEDRIPADIKAFVKRALG